MRAYYATKISENISRMPNGFLVCKNVPIARTGTQDYLGSELEIAERPDERVTVYREESEVFNPAALASFEGTPLVDEHPADDVTVNNAGNLMRGMVKDVRRGGGADTDKVVADIIVTDPAVVAEIENGKREISCGYSCDYEEAADGRIYQRNIRGNHVALVYKGRAGQDVAIKDSEPAADHEPPALTDPPKSERRAKFMNQSKKPNGGGFLARLLGVVAQDADPAIVAELAEAMLTPTAEGSPPTAPAPAVDAPAAPAAPADAPPPAAGDEPPAWAKTLIAEIAAIKATIAAKTPDVDPLDALEKELAGGEEDVTKPVSQMENGDGTGDSDAPVADAPAPVVDAPADAAPAADEATGNAPTGSAKDAIAAAKKTVAAIKDPATRRAVSDSMAGIIRQMYGVTPSTPPNSYAQIIAAKNAKAADAFPVYDDMEARQTAYDSRNPHIKKEVK